MPVGQSRSELPLIKLIVGLGLEGAILIILFAYGIFAILVLRQVRLMERTLMTPLSTLITLAAILNLVLTVVLLVGVLVFF